MPEGSLYLSVGRVTILVLQVKCLTLYLSPTQKILPFTQWLLKLAVNVCSSKVNERLRESIEISSNKYRTGPWTRLLRRRLSGTLYSGAFPAHEHSLTQEHSFY
jgi:hypothetical protein